MQRAFSVLAASFTFLITGSVAQAGLIGSDITITNTFGGLIFEGPTTVTVVEGSAEISNFGGFWTIDIEDSSISLTCDGVFCPDQDSLRADDLYLFEGLDWGGAGFLLDAVLSSNCVCTPALSLPTGTSLLLSFAGGSAFPSTGETIFIELEGSHISEPAALALFGLGLAGIARARRRRYTKQ